MGRMRVRIKKKDKRNEVEGDEDDEYPANQGV